MGLSAERFVNAFLVWLKQKYSTQKEGEQQWTQFWTAVSTPPASAVRARAGGTAPAAVAGYMAGVPGV